jgi:hypothetical protein
MKRLTIFFITLSIAVFVYVGLYGINFIQKTTEEEGFKTGIGPVTRASDCNCLPGYIPASDAESEYNGKFFITTNWGGIDYLFKPDGDSQYVYWINPHNSCGIKINELKGTYRNLTSQELFTNGSGYTYYGGLNCNMVKKKGPGVNFFCQNLSNPEKRRDCY